MDPSELRALIEEMAQALGKLMRLAGIGNITIHAAPAGNVTNGELREARALLARAKKPYRTREASIALALKALKLHVAGRSYTEIGEELGVTRQAAHQMVTQAKSLKAKK